MFVTIGVSNVQGVTLLNLAGTIARGALHVIGDATKAAERIRPYCSAISTTSFADLD